MIDGYNRQINYMRLSITDRCNLRCKYCMPKSGVHFIPHKEILRYDEIVRLVGLMSKLGVNRIRLTGGEPLVRKGVVALAEQIKKIDGISFLGLTTNGILLEEMAEDLYKAGVNGINISLDTLDQARFTSLTRRDLLHKAKNGLNAALSLPFDTVKINCVLASQSEEQDWLSVVELAKNHPVDVRLIEWMPMTGEAENATVRQEEAFLRIEQEFGALHPCQKVQAGGPAEYFQIDGFQGRIGMIHSMSHKFCHTCNRVRLTSTGNLKLCLFYDTGIALKPLLRGGASDEALIEAIVTSLRNKPKEHSGCVKQAEDDLLREKVLSGMGMYQTGG